MKFDKIAKYKQFINSISDQFPPYLLEAVDKILAVCIQNSIFEANNEDKMKIDWGKFKVPMIQNGVKLMKEINGAGFEAYVVGGAVRDILMGDPNPHDIDIATNMPIDKIKENYRTIEYGGGEKHGTVIVRYNDEDYELTQFRIEGDYSDARRPDSVEFVDSFEEDTKRRDFTINAMGIDADGNVIDHHGGASDIQEKKLRTVGKSVDRFNEDPLRVLRAVRFAARFGFDVSDEVVEAIKELKEKVNTTSVERIRDEIWKTIDYGGKNFTQALEFMKDTELFEVILPEIELTDEKIKAVERADSNDPVINFSILMNDMTGKDVNALGERITMTNPEKKSIAFIVNGLAAYTVIGKIHGGINKLLAMQIVINKDFPKLRKTYISIKGNDVEGIDKSIERYQAIASKAKSINKIIGSKGIKGEAFREAISSVVTWMYNNFETDNLPGEETIERYVEKL